MELSAVDFVAFFRAIHGHAPFPWQQQLVGRLAGDYDEWPMDEWPDVLDLPTGSGKTAALDAAIFHLALRFKCPERAALRVALVVDRRLVVDDAYERAKKIERCLADPTQLDEPGRSVVAEVASRLNYLACVRNTNANQSGDHQQRVEGDSGPPLVARRLRGGAPLEPDWALTPTQPTILCSTVDQVGSRLLFRGYGISNKMKPVHAGLLGKHTMILLDEAHLSDPFRETVHAVRDLGNADVKTVLLSATPGLRAKQPHQLTTQDYDNPVLRRRIYAPKRSVLCVESNDLIGAFTKKASEMADRLRHGDISTPVVGVIVNRVGLARAIFEKLRECETNDGSDAILLIGRSRGVERDRIARRLKPFRTGNKFRRAFSDDRSASEDANMGPLFVIATQCLEVGVDIDLDGLVTQAASLDALRQRFGRLNRDGRRIRTQGVIVALDKDVKKGADDPIYGDRIAKTWAALHQIAQEGIVDFGIHALAQCLEESEIDVTELAMPQAKAPVAMPAYFDLWSQTPPPATDPDIGLFLHGVERTSVGVSLAWRADLTEDDLKNNVDLVRLLQMMPPRAAEMVDVPIWAARAWLKQHRSRTDFADVPENIGDREINDTDKRGRQAFRWSGAGAPDTGCVFSSDLRPGDVLVVPAGYGGCDQFGWNPRSENPVTDVADEVARRFRKTTHAVRIARDVVATDDQWDHISDVLADEAATDSDLIERLLDVLPPESNKKNDDVEPLRSIREPLEALRRAKGRLMRIRYNDENDERLMLVAPRGLQLEQAPEGSSGVPSTEDDFPRTLRRPVSVDDHTDHVSQRVASFAATLNLPSCIAGDLKLAARLHDAGKADRRFQNYLSGGDPWTCLGGPAMAKPGMQVPKGAWRRAGLPKGWRHEALSVRMARAHPRFEEAHDPGLVLWLIGTHHGFGRPFFNFADPKADEILMPCLDVDQWNPICEPGPQSMAFNFNGMDWSTLYQQLRQRYGIWELAHLEAVLRLADHRASEAEERND